MATKATTQETINIVPLDIRVAKIRLIGDTPLISHAFPEKARKMIRDKRTGATVTSAKENVDPMQDFIESLYWLEGKPEEYTEEAFNRAVKNGAKWGFKCTSIKQAATATAFRSGWVPNQTTLRQSFFIKGWDDEFAEIKGSVPHIREDMVTLQGKSADVRWRAVFDTWYMDLKLEWNARGMFSLEQILNCISAAGYGNGLGDWRPERDGIFGRYTLDTTNVEPEKASKTKKK